MSSALGFGFIVLLICLTSLLADRLFDYKVRGYIYFFCNFIPFYLYKKTTKII
jgi:hypothetical protein